MALDLPGLVAKWDYAQDEVTNTNPGTMQVIAARPERLALGFSHAGVTDIAVFPFVRQQNRMRFFLLGNSTVWFYWYKHASMIALPWFFETANLAGDTVTFFEVYAVEPKG
jgi:hypothetical protein